MDVFEPLVTVRQDTSFYSHSMNVVGWLSGANSHPSIVYLASDPISSPLISITELVQYLVVCRISDLALGELRERIADATDPMYICKGVTCRVVQTRWHVTYFLFPISLSLSLSLSLPIIILRRVRACRPPSTDPTILVIYFILSSSYFTAPQHDVDVTSVFVANMSHPSLFFIRAPIFPYLL
jgi:hypothetical protein